MADGSPMARVCWDERLGLKPFVRKMSSFGRVLDMFQKPKIPDVRQKFADFSAFRSHFHFHNPAPPSPSIGMLQKKNHLKGLHSDPRDLHLDGIKNLGLMDDKYRNDWNLTKILYQNPELSFDSYQPCRTVE